MQNKSLREMSSTDESKKKQEKYEKEKKTNIFGAFISFLLYYKRNKW